MCLCVCGCVCVERVDMQPNVLGFMANLLECTSRVVRMFVCCAVVRMCVKLCMSLLMFVSVVHVQSCLPQQHAHKCVYEPGCYVQSITEQ